MAASSSDQELSVQDTKFYQDMANLMQLISKVIAYERENDILYKKSAIESGFEHFQGIFSRNNKPQDINTYRQLVKENWLKIRHLLPDTADTDDDNWILNKQCSIIFNLGEKLKQALEQRSGRSRRRLNVKVMVSIYYEKAKTITENAENYINRAIKESKNVDVENFRAKLEDANSSKLDLVFNYKLALLRLFTHIETNTDKLALINESMLKLQEVLLAGEDSPEDNSASNNNPAAGNDMLNNMVGQLGNVLNMITKDPNMAMAAQEAGANNNQPPDISQALNDPRAKEVLSNLNLDGSPIGQIFNQLLGSLGNANAGNNNNSASPANVAINTSNQLTNNESQTTTSANSDTVTTTISASEISAADTTVNNTSTQEIVDLP